MIKHLVEIKNYNDSCGKCKYQIKSKHGYLCGIFNEPLPTELSNKYNCRCDDCLSLGCAYDDEEVISKKLQKFIATQTTELKAKIAELEKEIQCLNSVVSNSVSKMELELLGASKIEASKLIWTGFIFYRKLEGHKIHICKNKVLNFAEFIDERINPELLEVKE